MRHICTYLYISKYIYIYKGLRGHISIYLSIYMRYICIWQDQNKCRKRPTIGAKETYNVRTFESWPVKREDSADVEPVHMGNKVFK